MMSIHNSEDDRRTVSPSPEGSADLLRRAITRTARRMRREAGGPLTSTQMATLASIRHQRETTPGALAEIEGVRRPTMTRVVSHLEDAGMIERRADPADGRCSLITITEDGQSYLDDQRSRKSAWLARVLDQLDPDEVATLERAAAILENSLEEVRD